MILIIQNASVISGTLLSQREMGVSVAGDMVAIPREFSATQSSWADLGEP
ncbi:hypothetical protein B1M_08057 [Burkholderia sp. TJI49]|nr:hypothetical protein B1M_08057 [Burkholderia sp. TJI49]